MSLSSPSATKPKRILFFGDSITQFGLSANGYITILKKQVDNAKFELLGAGVGGNKIYDLYLRLEEDILVKNPDLVFIYVGINDVWHKLSAGTGTDYPKFLKFYQALINKIQAHGSSVVLCTPTLIGEKKGGTNQLDSELDKFSSGINALALNNNLLLCDLRKVFSTYLTANNPHNLERGILTTDGVHLNDSGNELLAAQLLPFIK